MQKFIFGILILAASILVYRNVRSYDFVWNDPATISAQVRMSEASGAGSGAALQVPTTLKATGRFWRKPSGDLYIPVSHTGWTIESLLGKSSTASRARIFHFGNFAFNALNALLVFLILSFCLPNEWAAFLGALVFVLHPLQVEPVAWVSAFPYVLGSFFALVAIWQYLHFSRKSENQSRRKTNPFKHYYVATGSFVLAMLAFPAMAVTPVMAYLLERLRPNDRSLRPPRRPVWPLVLWLFLALPLCIWTISLQDSTAVRTLLPIWQRPIVAGDALTFYLLKLFVPIGIGPDYGRSPLFLHAHWWTYLSWLVPVFLGLIIMYWEEKRRVRVPAYGAALALLTVGLLPFLGLFAFDAQSTSTVANRYIYLAMLGPALAFGYTVSLPRKPLLTLAGLLVLAGLGYAATRQLQVWRNDEALWNHALAVNPNSPIAHSILADRYREEKNWEAARIHYQKVLETNATSPKTHFYLAEIERRRGDLPKAIELYRKVLALDPNYAAAYNSLGLALAANGQKAEAEANFEKAVNLTPDNPEVLLNLGRSYVGMQKFGQATTVLSKALTVAEDSGQESTSYQAEAHALLGLALAKTGQTDAAQQHLETALQLDSSHLESHRTLADIYFAQKRYEQALPHYQKAEEQITNDPDLFNNVGIILAMQKKYEKAVAQFSKALALRPNFANAHNNIGMAFFHLRRFKEATEHFKKALALNPNLADPYYYLGDIERWHGKESEALAYYYQALKIDPDHSDSHYRLGNYFMKEDKYDQAIRHYKAGLKSAPEDARLEGQLRRAERALEGQKSM